MAGLVPAIHGLSSRSVATAAYTFTQTPPFFDDATGPLKLPERDA